jgi:predicted nucleic-acid-binding Zn-ribbon protein
LQDDAARCRRRGRPARVEFFDQFFERLPEKVFRESNVAAAAAALERTAPDCTVTPSSGMYIAQGNWETSANGAGFMDPRLKPLKAAFKAIRDTATKALSQTEQSQEERSMRWKCKQCRYVKHFTNPVPLETAGRCPRCRSTEFRPVL